MSTGKALGRSALAGFEASRPDVANRCHRQLIWSEVGCRIHRHRLQWVARMGDRCAPAASTRSGSVDIDRNAIEASATRTLRGWRSTGWVPPDLDAKAYC